MPGCAAGEFFTLEQHHIRPTHLGEMIGHGAADDPAADNGDARVAGQATAAGLICSWRFSAW